MSIDSPVVCCVMCNHNYDDYLEEAMKSILNQDYSNLILCVVDDASSDNSPQIIERIADEDFRVVPIYLKEGCGAAEARNVAIRACWDKTDYFLITDSDDVCKQGKVREMLKKISVSPQIIGVYADYDIINMTTLNITREFKEPYDMRALHQNCIVHSSSMLRKSALEQIKTIVDGKPSFFDKELQGWRGNNTEFIGSCEDYGIFLKLSKVGLFSHIPKPLTLVRVHDKNQSQIDKVNKVWAKNVQRMRDTGCL